MAMEAKVRNLYTTGVGVFMSKWNSKYTITIIVIALVGLILVRQNFIERVIGLTKEDP